MAGNGKSCQLKCTFHRPAPALHPTSNTNTVTAKRTSLSKLDIRVRDQHILDPRSSRQSRSAFESQRSKRHRFASPAFFESWSFLCAIATTATDKMTPPCLSFPAKDVPKHVQVGLDGKRRKTKDMRRPIDLARDCELFGFLQYECGIDHPEIRDSRVSCWPVQRLFRQ